MTNQMENGKPNPKHIVLVHGACHGAWCWYKVATLLKSSGLKVTCLDMAASGINPKQITEVRSFSDYVAPLMEFIESLPPDEKVVIVGHSSGGYCIAAAMERFPEKIAAAVFATAFMPDPELPYSVLQDKLKSQEIPNAVEQYRFENGLNNPPTSALFQTDFLATLFYQLSPPEDLELASWVKRPEPLFDVAETQKALTVTKEKYGSVPRVFIMCGQDKIVPPNMQRWMTENKPMVDVKRIDGADHMVMFSKPNELSSTLVDVANKYV